MVRRPRQRMPRGADAALPQSFLQGLLGPLCSIDLEFAPTAGRAPVTVKGESGKPETLPLYTANDTVRGQVRDWAHAASAQAAKRTGSEACALRATARSREGAARSPALHRARDLASEGVS